MSSEPATKPSRVYGAVIVLTCICLCSGLGLSVMHARLKDAIDEKKIEAFNASLAAVLGEQETYPVLDDKASDGERVFFVSGEDGWLYAAEGAAEGYQSTIRVLVSVRAPAGERPPVGDNPEIHAVAVVESAETPGLGENIKLVEKEISVWAKLAGKPEGEARPPKFLERFTGKHLADLGDEEENPLGNIDALTGATMTSKAAIRAVRDAIRNKIMRATNKPE